ncbi:hypothetical protein SBF1_950053 [Candidatus Desulfosporosinus infrequens]|uniref:Uncharacterized protein n=1 Tax=Candidatus Desulfosporosinus infrequens TaxID=2043169 RepID=A0A2U3LXW1_9FIRM|nr:hypothetical protein SBF1_950053 [Candidatus Desulfosporosinus infrequens]
MCTVLVIFLSRFHSVSNLIPDVALVTVSGFVTGDVGYATYSNHDEQGR